MLTLIAFVTKSQSFSTPYELCLSAAGCHFIKVNLAWVSIKEQLRAVTGKNVNETAKLCWNRSKRRLPNPGNND